ncbi:MAG: phosphatase PAP2 family protein [bacterium]
MILIFRYLFFFCSFLCISAQDSLKSTSIANDFIKDGTIFLEDGASYFTYPLRADSKDWLIFAGLTATTYSFIYADNWVKEKIGRTTALTLNHDFWDIPTTYGIVAYANITALSTYAVGLFTRQNEIRKVGRMLFQSLSYSGITEMGFRMLVERTRPYYNQSQWDFHLFTTNNEFQSFPSGHTAVAFAFSTVLAEYFDTYYSRIAFYGLASLTAYARVLNNQHYLSDVFFGALVGISGGLHTIAQEKKRNNPNYLPSRLEVLPGFNQINFVYWLN